MTSLGTITLLIHAASNSGGFAHALSAWGGITGILAFVIAVGALFGRSQKAAKTTQLITNYRESATSWQSLAESRDEEISLLKKHVAEQENEITALTARVKMLEDLATGRSAVEQLAAQLTDIFTLIEEKIVSKHEFDSWQAEVRVSFENIAARVGGTGDSHGRAVAADSGKRAGSGPGG